MDEMRKKLNQQYKRAGEKKERGGKNAKKEKKIFMQNGASSFSK